MCGRFVLINDLSVISEAFNTQEESYGYRPVNVVLPSHGIEP